MAKVKTGKVGKPRTFTPDEFEKAWKDYFNDTDNNPWPRKEVIRGGERAGEVITIPTQRPYTELGFCAYHDLGEHYINQLSKSIEDKTDEISIQYSYILTRARAKCRAQKFEGAAVGAFNAGIISKDLGLIEKQQIGADPENPLMIPSIKVYNTAPPMASGENEADLERG